MNEKKAIAHAAMAFLFEAKAKGGMEHLCGVRNLECGVKGKRALLIQYIREVNQEDAPMKRFSRACPEPRALSPERSSGFTLIELMIVVAIIALLAAIAIPNVLRARTSANEAAAIGNIRALVSSMEMYRSVYQSYPSAVGNWQANMYTNPNPDFGPAPFNLVMTGTNTSKVQGFDYEFIGCGTGPCSTYTIRATPDTTSDGSRTFWGNDQGQTSHCSGLNANDIVPATAVTIDQQPVAC